MYSTQGGTQYSAPLWVLINTPPPVVAPSRHCRDARAYVHTTTAMYEIEYISPIEYTVHSPPAAVVLLRGNSNQNQIFCVNMEGYLVFGSVVGSDSYLISPPP